MLIKHDLESPYFTCMKSIRTEVTGARNLGEHLPYTHVTAFSLTSLFLEYFEYLPTNQSAKPKPLKVTFLTF